MKYTGNILTRLQSSLSPCIHRLSNIHCTLVSTLKFGERYPQNGDRNYRSPRFVRTDLYLRPLARMLFLRPAVSLTGCFFTSGTSGCSIGKIGSAFRSR